jgi:undecaprenyl-diphosphatase
MPLLVALAAAVLAGVLTAVARVVLHARGTHPSPAELAERTGLRALVRRRVGPLQVSGLALAVTLVGLGLAAGAFGFAAVQATRTSLWWVDAGMARWGSRAATPGSTAGLRLLTWLGATVTVALLALVAGLADAWRRARLGRRRFDGIAFLLLVALGQNLVANGVKLVVARPRPPVPPLAAESGYSFPSGHTAAATATAVALALIIGQGRSRRARVALAGLAGAVATAVAASRVLLGVHWVSDVIGGAAIGLVWVAAVTLLFGGRRLELGAELAGADRGRAPRTPGDDDVIGRGSDEGVQP